jgi:hypothetical protein
MFEEGSRPKTTTPLQRSIISSNSGGCCLRVDDTRERRYHNPNDWADCNDGERRRHRHDGWDDGDNGHYDHFCSEGPY